MRTALIAGSTGLIGKQLLELLLEDNYYNSVKAISRKPLEVKHDKLDNIVLDFDRLEENRERLQADDIFCCLGTTIRVAKTKEVFRKIDYHYPLELARIAKETGARQYLLVSALGADKNSAVFYNKVKGEVEDAIEQVLFESLHILRPSLLIGARAEYRSGEEAAKTFFKLFGFLVPLKYRGIQSSKVARAMFAFAKQNTQGNYVHESRELQDYQ